MTIDNIAGRRFGRLLVLQQVKNPAKHKNAKWECLCDCGTVKSVLAKNLKNGSTKSCGCYNKEMHSALFKKESGHSAFHKMLDTYKRNAMSRNLVFELTETEFKRIVDADCFYCGEKPSNYYKNRNDVYVANGIDRKSSDIGYITSNVVPCCKKCNYFKNSLTEKDFINHVNKIYEYQQQKKNKGENR